MLSWLEQKLLTKNRKPWGFKFSIEDVENSITEHEKNAIRQKLYYKFGDFFYEMEYSEEQIDRKIYEEAISRRHKDFRFMLGRYLRQAKRKDYQRYLDARTNPCTHYYDVSFDNRNFFVAKADIILPPLCGGFSVNVIAPEGVDVRYCGGPYTTHCKIFHMDYPDLKNDWVPSYNDCNKG